MSIDPKLTAALSKRFPADISYVDGLCEDVKKALTAKGLSSHVFAIQLLVREALNNAIIHGCRNDKKKLVSFYCLIDDVSVAIEVSDQGSGFNWRDTIDRKSEPSCQSGRGMAIMRSYAHEVYFNDEGNTVALTRKIS